MAYALMYSVMVSHVELQHLECSYVPLLRPTEQVNMHHILRLGICLT